LTYISVLFLDVHVVDLHEHRVLTLLLIQPHVHFRLLAVELRPLAVHFRSQAVYFGSLAEGRQLWTGRSSDGTSGGSDGRSTTIRSADFTSWQYFQHLRLLSQIIHNFWSLEALEPVDVTCLVIDDDW